MLQLWITGGSQSGKRNPLLNLIKRQNDNHHSNKFYSYARDENEVKY